MGNQFTPNRGGFFSHVFFPIRFSKDRRVEPAHAMTDYMDWKLVGKKG